MKFEKQLEKIIPQKDLKKLNIISFKLTPLEKSSTVLTYKRDDATSKFYNSKDIRTASFYKNLSLLIDNETYESFNRISIHLYRL